MEDRKQMIQNLYTIIGKKQVELDGFRNMINILQAKVQELENKLKEYEDDSSKSNEETC